MSSFRLAVQAVLLGVLVAACTSPPDHPRRVAISGAVNFRDAGGYATVDGKHVKRGVLFRSGDLSDLSTAGREFDDLGIQTVFDLRYDYERMKYPSRLPSERSVRVFNLRYEYERAKYPSRPPSERSVRVVEIPVYYPPLDRRESQRKILAGEVEDGHFRQLLIEANGALALNYHELWSELIRNLAAPGATPAVVHCADGKDRTGFAIAVILSAVGVPRETVYEDFLLSNVFLERRTRLYSFLAAFGSKFRVSRSEVRPLLEVQRAYLESAFAAIDAHYGTFDAYLRDGLGIDEPTLARLRAALTE